jgi:adenylate cyclase
MSAPLVHRRLAAILAADVVTYSRLMGLDEAGTLAAWKQHRSELIDVRIAEYEGRIVKLVGDGFLAEFPSVVNAVACAVMIQHGMRERSADVARDRRMELRIGINLGDVIIEADDIRGWRQCSCPPPGHCEAGRDRRLGSRSGERRYPA